MSETIDELIDRLRGTCNESWDICDWSMEDLQYLDEHIFECVGCGWWCDISELSPESNDEMFCDECNE